MKRYNRWNNIVGWAVFAVAALTYLATMEPSASLWDCSEFIATSYNARPFDRSLLAHHAAAARR